MRINKPFFIILPVFSVCASKLVTLKTEVVFADVGSNGTFGSPGSLPTSATNKKKLLSDFWKLLRDCK